MENINDIQKPTNVGNEVLADVSGSALSPIEWLQKEVYKRFGGETFLKVFSNEFEKAKQMEKDLLNAR
jgi:hypothetical protein